MRFRLMKMQSAGLFNHWGSMLMANPTVCLKEAQNRPLNNPRLTLVNLSGAFIVLVTGCALSAFVFICELVYKKCTRTS